MQGVLGGAAQAKHGVLHPGRHAARTGAGVDTPGAAVHSRQGAGEEELGPAHPVSLEHNVGGVGKHGHRQRIGACGAGRRRTTAGGVRVGQRTAHAREA